MKITKKKSIFEENLQKFDHLAKGDDYIEVTEWANGEGWDIAFNNKSISLTYGELEAINFLVKCLDYENQ